MSVEDNRDLDSGSQYEDMKTLLVRISRDSEQALGQLINTYRGLLYRYCCSLMGDTHMAEEALADVCMKLWSSRHDYNEAKGGMAYVRSICHNTCISMMRKNRAELTLEDIGTAQPFWAIPSTYDFTSHGSVTSDPSKSIVDRLVFCSLLRSALATLKANHRALIYLRYFEDYSYKEIAEHCSIPMGSVKSGLHYAIQHMRDTVIRIPGSQEALGDVMSHREQKN